MSTDTSQTAEVAVFAIMATVNLDRLIRVGRGGDVFVDDVSQFCSNRLANAERPGEKVVESHSPPGYLRNGNGIGMHLSA